ncbi:sensor domain-containing protein [Nonomuraea sp. NPDC046802]|uniref:sensor histidine kinase n=1 Tax=Nonomuraea sp. NPDC046802 TaxID=3154919 RepID=UPI0034095FDB
MAGSIGTAGASDRPPVNSPGVALRLHPARLLVTSWPWRSLAYIAATPVVAFLWLVTCWPLLIFAGLPLGHVERWRLRWIDRRATPNPHAPSTAQGLTSRARLRAGERSTWTELLHGALLLPLSLLNVALASVALLMPVMMVTASAALFVLLVLGVDPGSVTTVTDLPTSAVNDDAVAQVGFASLGVILFAAGMYVVTLAADGQRYLCRMLVSEPSAQLRERLDDVTRSRARITSAFDEERRRIERDLHDGAQQRLTSLAMTLGTMKYQLHRGIDISPLVDQASADAQQAVDELRDIVHGIYPSALREHDLAEALDDLVSRAERAGLAADIDLTIPPDLPANIEVGLYFAVSELVTNVTKHSRATTLTLHAVTTCQETLLITVEDNGHGGASPGSGTGLVGVIDRIETLGGRVAFSSPVGGPTRVSVEVPCASS